MADPAPPGDNIDHDAAAEADRRTAPGMPRWVKVSLIVVAALVALFVVLQLAGVGGEHGPRRHMPGNNMPGGHSPPAEHRP